MKNYTVLSSLSIMLALSALPSLSADEQYLLSMAPHQASTSKARGHAVNHAAPGKGSTHATKKAAKAASTKKATAAAVTKKATATPASNNQAEPGSVDTSPEAAAETPPTHSLYSNALELAVKQYRANPGGEAYNQVLGSLKAILAASGNTQALPAGILKDNPYLADFKPRVIESSGVRLWNFPKSNEKSQLLLQWADIKQQTIGKGRRKRVVTSSTPRFQELALAAPLTVKDAGVVSVKEAGKHLLLAGEGAEGALSVQAYKFAETGWQASPEFLAQIPSTLTSNLTGRLAFKGSDLIYNVGKLIQTTDSSGTRRFFPEAESATYKFLCKYTDAGYVVAQAVADEEPFAVVFQFMQAVQQARPDMEKSLLVDARLSSLPKYLGLQGKPLDASVRVVEMTVPPAHGQRFRLINLGKDDLIFDVGKVKGVWQIKAVFIAAPDAFLAETAKYFPLYSTFVQKNEAKTEAKNDAQDKKENGADSSPAAGSGFGGSRLKKKR